MPEIRKTTVYRPEDGGNEAERVVTCSQPANGQPAQSRVPFPVW